jgi:glutamyl-tRNA synthetase
VHIGNIRAAIFNWLYARHEGGSFLLRIEDTDLERSTPEAIATLLDVMDWLDIGVDEDPLYQTSQREKHAAAADTLIASGAAYRDAKGGGEEATLFRIPWDAESVPGVTTVGPAELKVHPEVPVSISHTGVSYAGVSKKGKPVPAAGCLAGFRDLTIRDAAGTVLFQIDQHLDAMMNGQSFTVENASTLTFTRRQVTFEDLVKGPLSKPLDSMKDFVIVRSDGSPVFHLANVCDDITQGITHIIRGDDHVENTYRHLFLFCALGAAPPRYAHLPMIVNAQGKPYSKRDGDAFVGDFRDKGYLPEALFNYLTLLGWSPGDDREKMTRDELVQAFSLDRVQRASAQMDLKKLLNLNGQYMAELPFDRFLDGCRDVVERMPWADHVEESQFTAVAELMQSRTKVLTDVETWDYFFVDIPEYDEKAVRKFLAKPGVPDALQSLSDALGTVDFSDCGAIEAAVAAVTEAAGIAPGKLNQPIRVAVTGCTVGAGVYETMALLGRDRTLARLAHAVALARQEAGEES